MLLVLRVAAGALLIACGLAGLLPSQHLALQSTARRSAPSQPAVAIDEPAQVQVLSPRSISPVRIRIATLRIDTAIVPVGIGKDGNMATPNDVRQVGWLSTSGQPGETGNVVMTGHKDTVTGRPAVFWDLGKLNQGDLVVLSTDAQTDLTYQVVQVRSYPVNRVPLQAIFGRNSESQLVLITCDGRFIRAAKSYDRRIVVYARLTSNEVPRGVHEF